MNNKILDCKVVRDTKLKQYREEISKLSRSPKLWIIQVGDNEVSNKYVSNKIKRCEECGIETSLSKFDNDITEEILIKEIEFKQDLYEAVILQLPVPKHINADKVIQHIKTEKDIDGLTEGNIGKVHNSNKNGIVPCTAVGIVDLLDYYNIDVTGMNVLLVGRSTLVNKPLAEVLTQRDATCTIAHSKTEMLPEMLSSGNFDMVISSVGKANLLRDVKTTYAINVGMQVIDGKLVGDFDADTLQCVFMTSNGSGGTGLLTQEAIVGNIIKCYKLQYK